MQSNKKQPRRFLRLKRIMEMFGVESRSTIYEMVARGDLPRPAKMPGSGVNIWDEAEVIELQNSILAQRDTAPAE